MFGWARNLLSKQTDASATQRDHSSLLTYFWLRSKGLFPPEIIGDIEAFYTERSIPRLNPDWPHSESASGTLKLPGECGGFELRDVDLAPGCAVFVQRYARCALNLAFKLSPAEADHYCGYH